MRGDAAAGGQAAAPTRISRARSGPDLTSPEIARAGSRGALAALAAFLVAVPLALLAMLVTSESERVERLDRAVADGLHDLVSGDAASVQALIWLGRLSDPWLLRAGALALAAWLFLRGRRRAALWLAVTVVVGGLVGLGLKLVVQRTRPAFDEPVYVASGYSFPSGHALNSMLICTAVVVALWPTLGRVGRAAAAGVGHRRRPCGRIRPRGTRRALPHRCRRRMGCRARDRGRHGRCAPGPRRRAPTTAPPRVEPAR